WITGASFPVRGVRPLSLSPGRTALRRRLEGRTLAAVTRFGKRVAVELEPEGRRSREWLVVEPRMTGQLLVTDPPTEAHVRMILELEAARRPPRRLLFWDRRGLGTIRLLDERGLAAALGPATLGPDGLSIGADDLRKHLGRSRRAVKVALLDQRAVAGIGNIYAAEILHRAAIDPRAACRRLPPAAWEAIAAATRSILAEAVECEGSTIGDATYKTADSRSGSFQDRHRVYGKTGKPCSTCGTPIVRCVQGQRSTFYCPACQWQPRRRCSRLS
ncbi:MAG: Fpg/Nei family DNA glycosylase, partial [Planctomycetia bacterium]